MLGLVMVFAAATALATENPLPRVDDLAGAKWSRVAGPDFGESVLDVRPPGSWYRTFAMMSTVDFDGELYRMWFVGGQKTSDAGVPYGDYERIGLATSTDGIHWTKTNGGQPVTGLEEIEQASPSVSISKLCWALTESYGLLRELLLLSIERGHMLGSGDIDEAVFH